MSATELTGKQETAEENKSLPGTFGIGMVGVYPIGTWFLCLQKRYACNIHMHLGAKHLERPRGDTSAD